MVYRTRVVLPGYTLGTPLVYIRLCVISRSTEVSGKNCLSKTLLKEDG